MKAIVFREYGGPEVLQLCEVEDPTAGPGEIVVDVRAASINGVDAKIRRGGGIYKARFPHILGRDFSGVVSAVGDGVQDLGVGDAVFGVLDQGKDGTYAERLAIRSELVIRKPAWLPHAEAAAIGLTGLTAVWALEETAHLRAGETILIHGGGGGVGSVAVQLAHYLGAKVLATASSLTREYVLSLGADQVIDYASEDFRKAAGLCDVVFDTVGGTTQIESYEVLKPGGRLIWIASAPSAFVPPRQDVLVQRPDVRRDRTHLQRVLDLIQVGAIALPVVQRFRLNEAAEAHRVVDGRHVVGKVVLIPG